MICSFLNNVCRESPEQKAERQRKDRERKRQKRALYVAGQHRCNAAYFRNISHMIANFSDMISIVQGDT